MAKVGRYEVPEDWPVKGEAGRTFNDKLKNGFFSTYMAGEVTIDVGYRGAFEDAVPILPHAIGVDLDYPEYDGKRLPFPDESIDTVYSSHMLEHVADFRATIRDWHRVLRSGGFIVCVVPHQFLYEKRRSLPSSWNADHKRFYTPASLLREFEASLRPNTYRVRYLRDNDEGFTYDIRPEEHSGGGYEIEVVVQKIARPGWDLAGLPDPRQDDLECVRGEVSRLTAERDALSRESARWFEAAILAKAEQISRNPTAGRTQPLRSLARLFRADRASTAAAIADSARKRGEWERAARFYLDALGSDPGVPELWLRLGDSLKAAGKSLESEFAYRRAAALQRRPTQLKL
ncbi:MAG TPA: methyltransferase domain-containing protein [Stellaceae bacterium]